MEIRLIKMTKLMAILLTAVMTAVITVIMSTMTIMQEYCNDNNIGRITSMTEMTTIRESHQ